ncbi:MAG: hypothetical protein Q3X95_03930 [Duodenibacillus sp.]|nr:hypothetical protein [Duodenibacillus sp.]
MEVFRSALRQWRESPKRVKGIARSQSVKNKDALAFYSRLRLETFAGAPAKARSAIHRRGTLEISHNEIVTELSWETLNNCRESLLELKILRKLAYHEQEKSHVFIGATSGMRSDSRLRDVAAGLLTTAIVSGT